MKKSLLSLLIVGLLVAISCLLVLLSTTVVWAHRTLLNTNTFVGTVAPVFKNPGVDSAVAARAVTTPAKRTQHSRAKRFSVPNLNSLGPGAGFSRKHRLAAGQTAHGRPIRR